MTRHTLLTAALIGLTATATTVRPTGAQSSAPSQPPATGTTGASRPAARIAGPSVSVQARIHGIVVTMHEPPRPVPDARVRLRNRAAQVVGTTKSDRKGEFTFGLPDAGTYYVELVDETGRVLAVEDVGETTVTVAEGRVSTTILRVPVALAGPWLNAAQAILGAAAASGVAAVVSTGPPASPER